MPDISKKPDAAESPFVLLHRGMQVDGLIALQRRGLEAMRHAAELVTEAQRAILTKQAGLFQSYFEPPDGAGENKASGANTIPAASDSVISNLEKSIQSAREITDDLRKCWFGIFDEMEACTKDAFETIERDRVKRSIGSKK